MFKKMGKLSLLVLFVAVFVLASFAAVQAQDNYVNDLQDEVEGTLFGEDADGLEGEISFTPQNYYAPETYPNSSEMVTDLVEKYKEIHPDVNLDLIELPSNESDARTWLTTRMTANRAPEIAWEQYYKKWEQAKNNWWLPLDSFLELPNPYVEDGKPGSERWKNLIPDFVWNETRSPQGKQYQLTLDWVETGLYYNQEIFNEVGVSADWDNWEDFLADLGKLQDAGYQTPIGVFILPGWSTYQWADDLVMSSVWEDKVPEFYMDKYNIPEGTSRTLTQEEFSKAVYDGKFSTSDPRFDAFLDIMKEWSQYWGEGFTSGSQSQNYQNFISGRLPMYWGGSWDMMNVSEEAQFDYGVTYLPEITEETSEYASGKIYRVGGPSGAAQYGIPLQVAEEGKLRETIDFLMFWSAQQNSGQLISESMMFLPIAKGVEADPQMASFQEVASLPIRLFPDPIGRLTSRGGNDYDRVMQNFLLGDIEKSEAKEMLQEIMESTVEELGMKYADEWNWYE